MVKMRVGIGQDSHRFLSEEHSKPCIIAGVNFDDIPGFQANSDGDVVFHAICNAITSLTGVVILGGIADELYTKDGITDSSIYLKKAVDSLGKQKISYISISLEGKRPLFKDRYEEMRQSIANAIGIKKDQVGITATTGEGLTDVGCGEGVNCIAIVTTEE